MATTTISLPDDQLARLRLVALSSRRSLDEVVREAVDVYLASLPESARQEEVARRANGISAHVIEPRSRTPDPARSNAIDAALARLRSKVPPDLTPEEIDAEIDAAWDEVRQARRERRTARD